MKSIPAAPLPRLSRLVTLLRRVSALGPRALATAVATLFAGGMASAAAPWDLRVVDTAGQAAPGVTIEFVDRPAGALASADVPVRRTSDATGKISTADLEVPPVGFRVANEAAPKEGAAGHWALRFVHGLRMEDSAAGVDLLGYKPMVYDLASDIVCVVEETGTIEISVKGAKADDRFHATFLDQRPEPESHRNAVMGGSFTGPAGSIRVPAGRGTLYLAQDGFLGAPILTREGPLMVSVTPGQTSTVDVRFLKGPTAKLLAPFDTIPFAKIEALAPDGKTVVGTLSFDASPLRIEARIPVTAAGERSPAEVPPVRLPKHLLRAVDVPLQLPAVEDPNATEPAKRYLERPPMELIFAIDPGSKKRLPEVSGGWMSEAKGGLILLSRALYGGRMSTGVERPAPGVLRAGSQAGSAANAAPEWTAEITVKNAAGAPLPMTEAFVSIPGSMLLRGITGQDGTLRVEGLRSETVAVGLVASVAEQTEIARPADVGSAEVSAAKGEIMTGHRVDLSGQWAPASEAANVGDLMVLVPVDAAAMAARRKFMTHAAPIAFVDAAGKFDFGSVPAGLYKLRAGKGSEAEIDLRPQGDGAASVTRAVLKLSGLGASFDVDLQRAR